MLEEKEKPLYGVPFFRLLEGLMIEKRVPLKL